MPMKTLTACISAFSILLGAALSDFVVLKGFPYDRYLIELHHDGSPAANFRCNKLAAVLGENLSVFDMQSGEQSRCFILATGTKDAAGNFQGKLGWQTWVSRATPWSSTVEIPAESIKALSKD